MLERSSEMEDTDLPVVSICIVADKNKAPQGFVPVCRLLLVFYYPLYRLHFR